ncbi:hypothetical protein, partial [Enterobacter intestinihominis]
AHYHIASEPLAPGRVGPDVPRILSTKIQNHLENNTDNTKHTHDRLIADHTRCHPTLTAQREIVDFINGQQDRSTPTVSYKKIRAHHTSIRISYCVVWLKK